MKFSREEWEEVLQDSGLHSKKARELAPNLKRRVEEREGKSKKREKIVIESKDITEPSNTYEGRIKNN